MHRLLSATKFQLAINLAAALIVLSGCASDGARTMSATNEQAAPSSPVSSSISDATVIPHIGSKGRAAYEDFLRQNFHRAFAISVDSAWGFATGRTPEDAVERALAGCQKHTTEPCRVYAMNLCVVYEDSNCTDAPGDLAAGKAAYATGDYLKAMAEFWPLAQAGNADAQLYVAEGYESNRGVYPSSEQAYRWYLAAAEGGKPYGWYRAGMLARGSSHNTFYDPAKGQALVRMAAEHGDPEAQFRLGEWYRLGVDMDVDLKQAALWYQRAAAQGHQRSQEILDADLPSVTN